VILQNNEIISQYNDMPLLKAFHSRRNPFKREYFSHGHSAFEVSLIVSGNGVYQVHNQCYRFRAGDVFLFSTNEIHCITEVTGEEELDVFNLQFEPRFIWIPGHESFDLRYLDVFFHRSSEFRHQLCYDDPRAEEVRTLLKRINQEFEEKNPYYEMMVKNLLLTALVCIRRNYGSYFEMNVQRKKPALVHQLNQVMYYIDSHLNDDLSIACLCRQANMSRSYFSSLFQELNGLSPGEYVIQKRIAQAAHLLQNTNRSIMEIAISSGFNSAANFNHAFRRQMNKSPSQFRADALKLMEKEQDI